MKTGLSLLNTLFILLLAFKASAQVPPVTWEKTIGGNSTERQSLFIQLSDGNYVAAGSSNSSLTYDKTEDTEGGYDYWVMLLDQTGQIVWDYSLGGTGNEEITQIMETTSHELMVFGTSSSSVSGDVTETCISKHFWILKMDLAGNILWQNSIGGGGGQELTAAISTPDGGYLMGGRGFTWPVDGDKTEVGYGENDYWIVKIDEDGNVEWDKTYGGDENDYLTALNLADDGGYLLLGSSLSDISGIKTENRIQHDDNWIIRIDNVGNIVWQNNIGGINSDFIDGCAQTSDGNYIVCGTSGSIASGDKTENNIGFSVDCWVYKINDITGEIMWQKVIGGNGYEKTELAIPSVSGDGVIIGISSVSNASGTKTEDGFGNEDYWIVKLNTNGNEVWQKTIGSDGFDYLTSLAEYPNGGILAAGWSNSDAGGFKSQDSYDGSYDLWLIKMGAPLSTNEIPLDEIQLSIYPNPTTGLFYVSIPNYSNTSNDHIRVLDLKGNLLKEEAVSSDLVPFDLTGFAKGIYFVELVCGDTVFREKVVLD